MWKMTVDPEEAPDEAQVVEIEYEAGNPVAIDGERLSPAQLLQRANEIAGRHGVGRVDIVENRFVGMKSRGCYETPGGTLLYHAHKAVESLTLDRQVVQLRDELMPRYAAAVYNGFWFAPEREAMQNLFDDIQQPVTGTARVKLYKGNVVTLGRKSPNSLYRQDAVTFEEDDVYSQIVQLRDELMPRYAAAVYNGFWFAPEREAMQNLFDDIQQPVTGTARVKLYKGNVVTLGRKSPNSLYRQDVVTFEEDDVYSQGDADGFIKLNALRLRIARTLAAGKGQ